MINKNELNEINSKTEKIEMKKINNRQILLEDLNHYNSNQIIIIDVRDGISYNHGHIPNAINIPLEEISNSINKLDKSKTIILYCMKGLLSEDGAKYLVEKGYDAYNLVCGYGKWLSNTLSVGNSTNNTHEEVEKSIRKKFHKSVFSKFTKAIKDYELLKDGDKVAVCISGGKDSMLMAKLFQELKRHNKSNFELEFLVMDPGYNSINREIIEKNARLLNVPITIFETDIFETVYEIEKSPCYLCARMRRGHLYSKAKELGCNKISLGHHYDDVIETILMGMMYGAQIQTMMPKLHSTNFEGMELIRPLYLVKEDDIKHWRDYNKLQFIQCACRFTETCTTCKPDGNTSSKRLEIKELIKQLKQTNPFIESNIFRSVENVNLSTVIAYKKDGEKHHFLDEYEVIK